MTLLEIAKSACSTASQLARASTDTKNAAILAIADELDAHQAEILAANERDLAAGREAGLTPALLDRLMLNPTRLGSIAADLRSVADLTDPVGERFDESTLPNGIRLRKQRVPLGVLGVIYEARPNVTIDVAGLALKTGNAAILRGGKETLRSNLALVEIIRAALAASGLPSDSIQYIEDTDRARILELLQLDEYVDIIIPRGGAGLHAFCREHSRIPVMTGGIGICHLFVDESADLDASLDILHNAKTQRPSVCNSLDVALVHASVAPAFLPRLVEHLGKDGVTFQADPVSFEIVGSDPRVSPAGEDAFDTEWLSLVLSLKIVNNIDEAIVHIAAHSTHHSDGILTRDQAHADRFVAEVDSAAVYVNASTRFTDGGQFGLGAEVAISTQRLHARGPMGLRELTTYKWVAIGDWNVRE
jgi:glutamate-5-semialdehyde dehydrogenase